MFPVFAPAADVYDVTVPVEDQSGPKRLEAFALALQTLSDRVQSEASANVQIDLSVPMEHPEQYVESFSYVTDSDTNLLAIDVHLDRQALQAFLPKPEEKKSQTLNLQITGITSLLALDALTNDLSQIKQVNAVTISQVINDKVTLLIVFQGNMASIIQALEQDQHLSALDTAESSDQSPLFFQWQD